MAEVSRKADSRGAASACKLSQRVRGAVVCILVILDGLSSCRDAPFKESSWLTHPLSVPPLTPRVQVQRHTYVRRYRIINA